MVGADPTLTGAFVWLGWAEKIEAAGLRLVPLSSNPIDAVWTDRKENKEGGTADDGLAVHDVKFAGERFDQQISVPFSRVMILYLKLFLILC